jgi:hypothetical protein
MKTLVRSAAIAAVLFAQPAFAAMDCNAMRDKYKADIDKMASANADKKAAMLRAVQVGHDRCMAGDELNAKAFFEMVSKDMTGQR